MVSSHPPTCEDYTIGWISALPKRELVVAIQMLDVKHPPPPRQNLYDDYGYTYGSIKNDYVVHNIVIACLPAGMPGKVSAARVVQPMKQTFPNLKIFLLVGIAGGVPRNPPAEDSLDDIHLGDVVVGWAEQTGVPSVLEYDLRRHHGPQDYTFLSFPDKPSRPLLGALGHMLAERELDKGQFHKHLVRCRKPAGKFCHPGPDKDILFEADYACHSQNGECKGCDRSRLVTRAPRTTNQPVFHQGTILTGDSVMQCAKERDFLSRKYHDAMAFEMEAAGFIDLTHGLVIRGISDYADSHKNSLWQNYAAATAGSFAKELLLQMENVDGRILFRPHIKTPGTAMDESIMSSALDNSMFEESSAMMANRRALRALVRGESHLKAAGPNLRANLIIALKLFDQARRILNSIPIVGDLTLFEVDMQSIQAALKMTFCKNLNVGERLKYLEAADSHCLDALGLSETTTMPELAERVRLEKAIVDGRTVELRARESEENPILIKMEKDRAVEGLERAMQDLRMANEKSYREHRKRAEGWLLQFKK